MFQLQTQQRLDLQAEADAYEEEIRSYIMWLADISWIGADKILEAAKGSLDY